MLKIKEGVDLKELEKFGFEYYNEEPHSYYQWGEDRYVVSLLVYEKIDNRKIYVLTPYDYNSEDSRGHLNILFELIKAGLVEKVGDSDDREI